MLTPVCSARFAKNAAPPWQTWDRSGNKFAFSISRVEK